ncbi:MAG: AtpZ/AtpI family protein [Planctomycetota bacterium]|nr:MAG: AtpZ/AtpI family protein [Planctomycetota bacterium]
MYEILKYLNLPLEFGCIIIIFTLLGYGFDQLFSTGPLGILGGCIFGFGAGLYHLKRALKDFNSNSQEKNQSKKE